MCFLGFVPLRFLTVIFGILLALCNIGGICVSLNNLEGTKSKIQIIMCISIAFDLFINLAICVGIYGVIRSIVTCIYMFICAIVCYFVIKIVVAKAIVGVEDKETELVVTIWYQFDVVFAGICLMTAIPFSLKLAAKDTNIV